jgi:hypothetical protein
VNPFEPARKVADAVLYEGYILYPYTASAPKNRIRWQFGVVVPEAYAVQGTGEASQMQTEVLLECDGSAEVDVLVRFLQVEARQVEAWRQAAFVPVESLALAAKKYVTFDEGVERELAIHLRLGIEDRTAVPIASPAQESIEPFADAGGAPAGRIVRRRWPLHGAITVESERVAARPGLCKLRVRIDNSSAVVPGERSSALRTAFVSTHTLLHARGGRFLSALDPPNDAREATAQLDNRHTWPVLAGDARSDSQRSSLVLSSPIILYDFPAVAPQSEADSFDATEVDELMMLSVRSLSDEERAEARATDERARAVIDRAERFGPDELARLHGMLDIPAMDCVFVNGTKVSKGSRVRLHPKRRADVWDLFLDGKLATVRAIHQDVENLMYVAVSVDDDPASELHDWYGRSLFFYPDEVEPVGVMVP